VNRLVRSKEVAARTAFRFQGKNRSLARPLQA
jgi:hypothetical protein